MDLDAKEDLIVAFLELSEGFLVVAWRVKVRFGVAAGWVWRSIVRYLTGATGLKGKDI